MHDPPARYPRYRWLLLGIAWMTQVLGSWSTFMVASLAYVLFPDLGLNQAQYTMIFTGPLIAPIFFSLLGGAFCDRYGIRLTVSIGAVATALAGLSRGFANGFEVLFALACIQGAAASLVMPNLPKLVGVWFPAREFGVASGVYVSGQAIGMSIGLLTGPLFSNWRMAFLIVGLIALVVAVLWSVLGRSYPPGMVVPRPPMVAGLAKGLASRNMRLVCVGQFLLMAGFMTFAGNLPKALVGVHGVGGEAAGAASSALTWGVVFGSIMLPALSDRIGLRKPFVYAGAAISAIGYLGGWYLAPGWVVLPLVGVGGFFLGGLVTTMFTFPLELPEIGHRYAGGTAGLQAACANLGGVLGPLLVTSPLVSAGTRLAYDAGFLAGAGFLAMIAVPVAFVMETGRARRARAAGAPLPRTSRPGEP